MELLERIGQRLRLQDLRILMAVAHAGSMSKAAQSLNTTQPAISRSIAELEHTLGVPLRDRKVDFILGRVSEPIDEDIAAEVLFYDRTFVVASPHSKWSRRRKIELLELAEEAWGLPPSGTLIASLVADAFRAKGMDVPRKGVATGSIHLLSALVASGPFLITLPGSVLRFGTNLPALKVLSVDLPVPPWPVGLMMLKDRTVSPVVQLFFEFAREVTKPLTR